MGPFLLTLAVALAGAMAFLKLRVPVGAMVGAMIFVAAYNLLGGGAFVYSDMSYVLQVCSGVLVGSKITMGTVKSLRYLWKPYLAMMALLLSVTVLLSLLLDRFSSLDTITALMALSPGGMTDLTILSTAFGANSAYVALLHTCRMLVIVLTVPPFLKYCGAHSGNAPAQETDTAPSRARPHLLTALAAGTALAALFVLLNIRAGAILGAMIGSSLVTISGRHYACPPLFTLALQVTAGAFIGARVTQETVATLPQLWPAVLCVAATVWIYLLVIGTLFHRCFKLDHTTAMIASVPGGLSEMTLMASDLGADMPTVATLHTLRVFSIIFIVPNLAALLLCLH